MGRIVRVAGAARGEGGEFGGHRLTEQHTARPAQHRDAGRVHLGTVTGMDFRAVFGRHVGGVDDVLDVTMKCKLSEDVIDLPHQARVVRKTPHGVGFEFTPLTDNVRKGFQNVVDDYVSSKFAESQYAS